MVNSILEYVLLIETQFEKVEFSDPSHFKINRDFLELLDFDTESKSVVKHDPKDLL